jgi:acyl-CoA dehydrogenase
VDFQLAPQIHDYQHRLKKFVSQHRLSLEQDAQPHDEHKNIRLALLEQLRSEAKADGLWALQPH